MRVDPNEVVFLSTSEVPVVAIKDAMGFPVLYVPVRTDFEESETEALQRAGRICAVLSHGQERRIREAQERRSGQPDKV